MRLAVIAALLAVMPLIAFADTVTIVARVPAVVHALLELPDGSFAFSGSRLGILRTDGTVEFIAAPGVALGGLAMTPDGAFSTSRNPSGIGIVRRIDRAAYASDYRVRFGAGVGHPVAGRDGDVYFAETAKDVLGRITRFGELFEIPLPPALAAPCTLLGDTDGAVWVIGRRAVARIVDGEIERIFVADPGLFTGCIPGLGFLGEMIGPDGSLWLIIPSASGKGSYRGGSIVRMTPDGRFEEVVRVSHGMYIGFVRALADGSILYTSGAYAGLPPHPPPLRPSIRRLMPDGTRSELLLPLGPNGEYLWIQSMVVSRSGVVWIALGGGDGTTVIGRLNLE